MAGFEDNTAIHAKLAWRLNYFYKIKFSDMETGWVDKDGNFSAKQPRLSTKPYR